MRAAVPEDGLAGQALAEPVLAADGRVLCRAGAVLTVPVLEKLRQLEVDVVYVDDPGFGGIDARESVGCFAKSTMRRIMASAASAVAAGRVPAGLNDRDIERVAAEVLDAAAGDLPPCLLWSRERGLGAVGQVDWAEPGAVAGALAIHALNTALVVAASGRSLRLGPAQLPHLVVAALVLDVGMAAALGPVAWRRTGDLDAEERGRLRLHPQASLEAFDGSAHWDTFQRIAVLQHHERLDGSGYPYGLSGDRLHPAVLLVAAADMYAALCEPRPHRAAWRPEDVVEMLMSTAGMEFPVEVVRAVVSAVGLYPRGGTVALSDGRTGVVVRSGQGNFDRPTVRIDGEEVDLNRDLTLALQGIVA